MTLVGLPAAPCLCILRNGSKCIHGSVPITKDNNAPLTKPCNGLLRGTHPDHHKWLLGPRFNFRKNLKQLVGRTVHKLKPDHAHINVGVVQGDDSALGKNGGLSNKLCRHIHRVARGSKAGNNLGNGLACRLAKRRNIQANLLGPISQQNTCAARLGDDGKVLSARSLAMKKNLHNVEHVLFITCTHNPFLLNQTIKDAVFACQRTGVRGSRTGTCAKAPHLGQNNGLIKLHGLLGNRSKGMSVV